tara:strand:+ start:2306 stop:3172 length:867 start_codon:yes stop_codon:yes gene_type:complete
MIKIVLHSLPNEIDQVSWIVDQLVRSSRFIDPTNFSLDFTLNVSNEDTNWEKSILSKEFCIKKFNYIFDKSPFINQNKISYDQTGCNTVRRNAIREEDNTTHIIYLDTDLIFPETILYYLYESITQITNEYYLVTPQIFQLWDSSWDVISHPEYRNIPREEKQWLKNPYQVFEHQPTDVKLLKSPFIKFGGGWFNMFSKNLLKLIDIPNSLGHYGLDDTYVANAANILLEKKYDVQQYILNDIVVKEDRIYRSYSMDNFIHRNKNQDNMRENSMISYNKELQSFKEKI